MNRRISTTVLLILLLAFQAFSQTIIKGKLLDESGKEPLIGASVTVKGTGAGVVTNNEGAFELNYNGGFPITLSFSYIGYQTNEKSFEKNEAISIRLQPSNQSLAEVVVTSRRRKEAVQDIPIPITVLSASQLENSQSFNVNRVKELVPSVQLYSSNPRNTTLNIRGLGSTFCFNSLVCN